MGVTLGATTVRSILVGDSMDDNKAKLDQKTLTDRGLTAEPQAGALKDETGEPEKTGRGEEENPFLRKGKVAHTPPKRDGSLDRINEELQRRRDFLDLSFLTQDTEVDCITVESSQEDFIRGKRKKKNRQEIEGKVTESSRKSRDENLPKKGRSESDNAKKSEVNVEPSLTMKKLSKKINELVTFGRENSNVHKRVKVLANEISSLVRIVTAEARDNKMTIMELETEIAEHREAKKDLEEKHLEFQNKEERNMCTTRSTQTGKFDLRCRKIETYEDFLVVQDDEWEEECFKVTTVESGNPLKQNIDNIVYFCDEDEDKQERWYKQIKSRYPELEEVPKTKCEGGSYITLEQTVKYRVGTDAKKKIKNTIVLFHDLSKQSESEQTNVYNLLTTARTMSSNMELEEIDVTLPQGLKMDRMRKMTEAVFHDTNIQVTIYTPANVERSNAIPKKKHNGEAILIEGKGTT
jgi:hypothetical protein